jgi:hypothetical protein
VEAKATLAEPRGIAGKLSMLNSWEPESNVVNAPEIVADYWKRLAEKQAGLGALVLV